MGINEPDRTLEDQLFLVGLFAAVISIFILFIYHRLESIHFFKSCIWDQLFSIYCPGCGGTRAVKALLKGHIYQSILLHPLVPYSASIYFVFMCSQIIYRLSHRRIKAIRFHNWFLYVALIIIILNWLIKNILRMVWGITF